MVGCLLLLAKALLVTWGAMILEKLWRRKFSSELGIGCKQTIPRAETESLI